MTTMLNLGTAICMSLIEFFYFGLFFTRNPKRGQVELILAVGLNMLISFMTSEVALPPLVNGVLTLTGFVILASMFEGKQFSKLLFIALWFSLSATVEMIGLALAPKLQIAHGTNGENAFVEVFTVMMQSLLFVPYKMFIRRKLGNKQNRNLYGLTLLPIINFFTVSVVFFINHGRATDELYVVVIGALINTLIGYVLIAEFDKAFAASQQGIAVQRRFREIQKQNSHLATQYQLMFDLVHSENQFFLSLDKDKLSHHTLVKRLEARLMKVNQILIQLEPVSMDGTTAVLEYFIENAKKKGITVVDNCESVNTCHNQKTLVERMVIMTIILSNAIKQAVISEERFVAINVIQNELGLIFTVTNSFVPRADISNYSIENLQHYGIDLHQAAQSVHELNGEFDISTQENFFKADIVIPDQITDNAY